MTARTRNKVVARSLERLTGAPYQSCLAAVPVLQRLPRGTEAEELEELLAGGEPVRHLTVRFAERVDVEDALVPPFAAWVHPRSEVFFQDVNHEELVFFTTVAPPDADLPGNATLLVDDVYFAGLPRPGVWQTPFRSWTRACKATLQTTADDWSIDFGASRADPSLVPPQRTRELSFRSDRLWTVEPEEAVPGPGFAWLRLPFAVLDVDTALSRNTLYSDWPPGKRDHGAATAAASIDALFVPDILFRAWRDLGTSIPPADQWALRSGWHEWSGGEEQPSWYGLDLPDYSVLWLRVAPDRPTAPAPFVR